MALGFDYGTANCSVAQVVDGNSRAIPLTDGANTIPSTLSAPTRDSVSEYLYRHMHVQPGGETAETLLRNSINANQREGIQLLPGDVCFGKEATAQYLEDPTFCHYVKSPKSFLGILGLREIQLAAFEDLVCAMMANVKRQAEQFLQKDLSQVVIGRPVNFHNLGGEKSNQQAIGILQSAARRVGYKDIEFQYEPVAAGLDFESTLTTNKVVLVVDVGGGTTDCSMIEMGPRWFGKVERKESLIGHIGKRIGGNDMDIAIAFKLFMEEFGKNSERKNGRPLPTMLFWDPIAINDVEAQRRFYAYDNLNELKRFAIDAVHSEKVCRLIEVFQNTLGHQIIQTAEDTKIALGQSSVHTAQIDLPSECLNISVDTERLEAAIVTPLKKVTDLVKESVVQSGTQPDVVYITGGSARSPIIRQAIKSVLPDTPIASGDYDCSVASGLARWADLCFR